MMIFLSITFALAWITGLAVYLTGGLQHSLQVAPGLPLAVILLAVPYMWAPALGNILTRLITHEGWGNTFLRPNFRRGWPFWIAAWFLPGILTVAGGALFFLLFPANFDSNLTVIRSLTGRTPALAAFSPWTIVLIETTQALLLSPILNAIATFGEEFGWRAYLLPKLLPLGWRKAVLVIGVIWGVWHWPVIWMGYEYGFSYPGYPWVGPLLFIPVTFCFGVLLSWLAIRGKSVWPAVIGHAAINGIAGLTLLMVKGSPNSLLGPSPVGVIGLVGYAVVALVLFFTNPLKIEQSMATTTPEVVEAAIHQA